MTPSKQTNTLKITIIIISIIALFLVVVLALMAYNKTKSKDTGSTSSSTSQTSDTTSSDPQKADEIKTGPYTNPYFPTLKLAYPSGWTFGSATTNSPYLDLPTSLLTFNSKDTTVLVTIAPYIQPQCGGSGGELLSSTKLNSQIYKIVSRVGDLSEDKTNNPQNVKYTSIEGNYICPIDGFIATNIDVAQAPKEYKDYITQAQESYNKDARDLTKVNYFYSIKVYSQGSDGTITKDNPSISSIDDLIKGFQF